MVVVVGFISYILLFIRNVRKSHYLICDTIYAKSLLSPSGMFIFRAYDCDYGRVDSPIYTIINAADVALINSQTGIHISGG